jgi:quercetin dioxygenase-like cupin family protein
MQEIEVVAKTDSLRVRVMALAPRETSERHYHTEVTDDIFCLTGRILVRMNQPDQECELNPGQRCRIKADRVHQIENLDNEEATYPLVQGIGMYDFNLVKD